MPLLGKLSADEAQIEERLRTISQCVCALGVVGFALYELRSVLVPLVLAVALKYVLEPVIDLLSKRPLVCWGRIMCSRKPRVGNVTPRLRPFAEHALQLRLPYWLAVCVALLLSFATLGLLGFIVADSVHVFSKHADMYGARVQTLLMSGLGWYSRVQARLSLGSNGNVTSVQSAALLHNVSTADDELSSRLAELAHKIPVTSLVMHGLTSMLEAVSNLFVVMLFAVYLLLGDSGDTTATGGSDAPIGSQDTSVDAQANAQIHAYIRGKVMMSLLVAMLTALALFALGVDLWLVFGLLAFWLNFIPNVGTVLAVALPMPLVVLDPSFSTIGMALAFALPLSAHAFAGNVLEPLLFGHTLKLHPVAILLSLLLWGAVWGITGMVLAVPITAVLRLKLASINHPLPKYVSQLLVGGGNKSPRVAPMHNAALSRALEDLPEDGRCPLIRNMESQACRAELRESIGSTLAAIPADAGTRLVAPANGHPTRSSLELAHSAAGSSDAV